MQSSMINFYSFVYINKKRKQNKPIFSHVSAGRLKQGPFSKSCLPAPFVPTQASYTKALKKKKNLFLNISARGCDTGQNLDDFHFPVLQT